MHFFRVYVKAGGTGGIIGNTGGRFYTMNGPNGDAALLTSFTPCTSCYLLSLRIPIFFKYSRKSDSLK